MDTDKSISRGGWMKTPLWWCKLFHTETTRPVNGHYTCLGCGREYECDWDQGPINLKEEEHERREHQLGFWGRGRC